LAEKLIRTGAEIRFQSQVTGAGRSADRRIDVSAENHRFETDLILVSIGIRPADGLAESAGVRTNRGIIINESFETSIKDIYAAGDNTRTEAGYSTELWHAAEYQGILAGHSMAGNPQPFAARLFRLKCEVQGSYYFSLNYRDSRNLEQQSTGTAEVRQTWFVESDRVRGVVMKNDRERAKLYEAAVAAGWSMDRVRNELRL
jgi:nitrite reductase (NADH) large subunit